MNQENNYHISFFRPTTTRAKYNRNVVLWLISIWAIAIFGFHFLLKAIEKPTPEPQLIAFNKVWDNIKADDATHEEIREFAHATLHVTCKVFIAPNDRKAIGNGLSWAAFTLADSAQKVALESALGTFEKEAATAKVITDPAYIKSKMELTAIGQGILELDPNTVYAKILALELHSSDLQTFSDENKAIVETCMPKYTIHNRSVLTDTQFLGFPFHYFYTAVFLMILFIGLCWLYCYRVDNYNKSIGLVE